MKRFITIAAIGLAGLALMVAVSAARIAERTSEQVQPALGDTIGALPTFYQSGNSYLPRISGADFAVGGTASSTADFSLDAGNNTLHVRFLNCGGNQNGGALTADSNGLISCSDDNDSGANSRPASNSLDWDEIVDSMTLDGNTTTNLNSKTLSFGGLSLVGTNASVSGNFEVGGTASISGAVKARIAINSTTIPALTIGADANNSDWGLSLNGGRAMIGYDSSDVGLVLDGGTSKGIKFVVGGTTGTFNSGTKILTLSSDASGASLSRNLEVSGYASISGQFLSTGTASNSYSGSLELVKGLRLTGATGLITGSGTGSNSFTGSLNVSKSITATKNVTAALFQGSGGGSSSFAGSLDLTKSLTSSKTVTATQFLGSGAASNSFVGSLDVTKGIYAKGNLSFDGELLPDGLICSNGQILKKTGANDWDCATDATSTSAGNVADGLDIGVTGSTLVAIGSLSFDANMFNFANVASAGTVTLDWTNGPASRSFAEQVTGAWEFRGTASVSPHFNVGGFTVLANSMAQFASSTNNFAQINVQNFSPGASASSDLVFTTDTGNQNRGFLDIGINSSLYQDAPFGVASRSEGYIYMQDRSLSIGTASTSIKAYLKFFAGGTTITPPSLMTLRQSGVSISQGFEVQGTGSASAAGSWDVSKGIRGVDITATQRFLGQGTGSNSFAGSLDVSKGIRGVDLTASQRFLGQGTGSNSFAGSLELAKGLRLTGSTGLITGSGTGSNSFSGSLEVSKGLRLSGATGLVTSSGTASNSFSGSIAISKGISAAKWTGAFAAGALASHSFFGSLSGTTDNTLSVGTSDNKLKNLWANIVRAVTQFFLPTSTAPALTTQGQLAMNTASTSLEFYDGTGSSKEHGLTPRKCVSQSLAGADLTSKNQWTIFNGDEPYSIKDVFVTASGSNSLTWNLLTGSATVPVTNVFTTGKQASGSALVKYTGPGGFFNTASISDGQKLDIRVTSTSAALDSVFVRVCMELDTTP